MASRLLSVRSNPLIYPAGWAPGVDWSHPAAGTITRFAAVPAGQAFMDLVRGNYTSAGATGGVVARTNSNLGPAVDFTSAAGAGAESFSGMSTANDSTATIAGFILPNSNSTGGVFNSSSSGSSGLQLAMDTNLRFNISNINYLNTSVALAIGSPYFVVGSYLAATVVNFMAVNLKTGQIQIQAVTHATTANAPNGTYYVGSTGFSQPLQGQLGPVMFSNAYLTIPQLLAWARDPWEFWYPRAFDLSGMRVGVITDILMPQIWM